LEDDITDLVEYLSRRLVEVNFHYLCEDEGLNSLNNIDVEDLRECRNMLNQFMGDTQPELLTLVGAQITRKFYGINHVPLGLYENITWKNTGRITTIYTVPSTRAANRTNSEEDIAQVFDDLANFLRVELGVVLPIE
jgi:hypothetical protein